MEDEGFGSCLSSAHLFPPPDSSHLQPFKVLRGLRTRYPQTWHLITVHFPAEGIWGKANVRRILWPCPGAGQKTLLWEVTSLRMRASVLSHSVVSNSLWPHRLWPAQLLWPWDFPGKHTGVGCHFFLQGIFPTEGLNPGLLHCKPILYHWVTWEPRCKVYLTQNLLF